MCLDRNEESNISKDFQKYNSGQLFETTCRLFYNMNCLEELILMNFITNTQEDSDTWEKVSKQYFS